MPYADLVFSCITTGKTETHNHEMAQSGVTFAFPFCRNQPIWCMSRVWHQPSQVGKAYSWFQWWNCLGPSEHVPVHPGVTVATFCWVFRTQQGMVFCCLNWVVTTAVTFPHFPWVREVFLFYHTIECFLVLWVFCCFQISGLVCMGSKIIELLKSNPIFGFCQDLYK
jgi:hypothetical protein